MSRKRARMRRRSFSMAEAVVCVALVGVLLVAAVTTAAFSRTIEYRVSTRDRGWLLARELMAEISAQPFADPQTGTATFGIESGEAGTGTRALWDDFDDYSGWQDSPPQAKDGTVMADLTEWKRQVRIERVLGTANLTPSGSETGLRTCVVIVTRNGVVMARLASVRSDAWTLETQ